MKNFPYKLVLSLCRKNKIKLMDLETKFKKQVKVIKMTGCKDLFYDTSWSVGNNKIMLGKYKNKENKLLSFFHEFAHCQQKGKFVTKYEQEKNAWDTGISIAKQNGIFFSPNALQWAKKQLKTYKRGFPGE